MKTKRLLASLLLMIVLSFSLCQRALAVPEKYRTGHEPVAIIADGILARPLGLASTVIGATFFVITLPFSLPSGSVGEVKRQLVDYPVWFTFKRPLGEFGVRYSGPPTPAHKKASRTKQPQKGDGDQQSD